MEFEWDPEKSRTNKIKHGLDFETAQSLWLDDNLIVIKAPYPVEERWILISWLNRKLWTAIYTMRMDRIRLISVRRARKGEAELYEKESKFDQ